MELTEKLVQLDALQKKLYAFTCAESSLYLDSVTVAPKNTAEGRGVALSILAGEHQKLLTGGGAAAPRVRKDDPHPGGGVYGLHRADQPGQRCLA